MVKLQVRDGIDQDWETVESFGSPFAADMGLTYYADHTAYTGSYWQIVQGSRVLDSGRFR